MTFVNWNLSIFKRVYILLILSFRDKKSSTRALASKYLKNENRLSMSAAILIFMAATQTINLIKKLQIECARLQKPLNINLASS